MADDDVPQVPSSSIVTRTPSDTGRPQEISIVPEFSDLANQFLVWDPETGQPVWKLIGDVQVSFGSPAPILANDNGAFLAGDGLPYLFRGLLVAQ